MTVLLNTHASCHMLLRVISFLMSAFRFIAKRSMPEVVFVVRRVFFSCRKRLQLGPILTDNMKCLFSVMAVTKKFPTYIILQ
jgi:hypothetical protein